MTEIPQRNDKQRNVLDAAREAPAPQESNSPGRLDSADGNDNPKAGGLGWEFHLSAWERCAARED